MGKRTAIGYFLIILSILLGGALFLKSAYPEGQPTISNGDQIIAGFTAPANGNSTDTARAIAYFITQKSDGLLAVPYVEIPDHGGGIFGVHYNVVITKNAETMNEADRKAVRELAGEIFKLTTKYIIDPAPTSLTHMGVQIIDPDIWWWGGHERGSARIFIAARDALSKVPDSASGTQWLEAASENPQKLVMDSTLQDLLERLRRAEENK